MKELTAKQLKRLFEIIEINVVHVASGTLTLFHPESSPMPWCQHSVRVDG